MLFRTLILFIVVMVSGAAQAGAVDLKSPENQNAPKESGLAARVNGTDITETEVEAMIEQIIPTRLFHRGIPPEEKAEFREEAIKKIIESELLSQEAERAGIKVTDEDVGKLFKEQRARFKSAFEFTEALKRKGMTEQAFREKLRKSLLINGLLEARIDKAVSVNDTELRERYEAEKEKLTLPEKVRFNEVWISMPSDSDTDLKAKKTRTAEEILEKAKAGSDFCELAATYSEDELKEKCGDSGYINSSMLEEVFERDLKLMKEGEFRIISSGKGLIIVKLMERIPQKQLSFDEVKERLRKELLSSRQKEAVEKLIAGLRTAAKIEVYNK